LSALPSILFGASFTLTLAWILGKLCLRRLPAPPVIALAIGAAAESSIIFPLLTVGLGYRLSFVLLAVVCLALYLWLRPAPPLLTDPTTAPADRISRIVAFTALAAYAALYIISALAPELEPDAIGYHLGLTAEYVRRAAFPNRITFHEMLPQGLEMLFVPAFAFGRHSAARLVHCAFLLATVPLIVRTGRRLHLPDRISLAAATFYFCAPVTGITGTSAYTDAAGVFFTLAAFYLLLVWRDTRDWRYLVPTGVAAGFCYAIKFPGGLVAVLAAAFVFFHGERKRWLLPAAASIAVALPWIVRAFVLTGNPFAPLFNRQFPNPFFHVSLERDLATSLGSFGGLPPLRVAYELIAGGSFNGMLGPVFFLLPLALLGLRRPAGRWCLLAATLLALPWFSNTGARFLMPALPFLALALAIALPRPVAWFAIALQAVACWPQVVALYHPAYTWRLQRIPWRAALRLQPEPEYLASLINEYPVARLIEDHTQPGDRVFSLIAVATAYTTREVLGYWHSAQAETLNDSIRAGLSPNDRIYNVQADWPARALSGLRIRVTQDSPTEWQIHDVCLYNGAARIVPNPPWQLHGSPNEWELPLAFDNNRATRWRTWEPARAGSYVEADFGRPIELTGAAITTPAPPFIEFYGREDGQWRLLPVRVSSAPMPLGDVRLSATAALRRAGFRYLLTRDEAWAGHESDWGLTRAAELGPTILYRID